VKTTDLRTKRRRRWALFSGLDIGADGDPYLDRLEMLKTPLFGLYLHHIHREDREADPHDHPWGFASVVLSGAYQENVWPDKRDAGCYFRRARPRWSLRRIGRGGAHIITSVTVPLWTLVLTGPHRGEWGFWRDGQFTRWQDYQYAELARSGRFRKTQP
jgi:hypothetical protein